MQSDQFKPTSYLKLGKKYKFTDREQIPLRRIVDFQSLLPYLSCYTMLSCYPYHVVLAVFARIVRIRKYFQGLDATNVKYTCFQLRILSFKYTGLGYNLQAT